ncbi:MULTISPECIES: hypothetical protein [Mesorhizobium]|nr:MULTISPECIES: hypothetical protein [Mesorhizobium]
MADLKFPPTAAKMGAKLSCIIRADHQGRPSGPTIWADHLGK